VLDAAESAAIATAGRFAARRAHALVAYNETVAGLLARLAPGRRVVRILNGVDGTRFRPPADAAERERLRASFNWDERPRVLFAGRPVAKKGFDVARAAAARGGFALVVAGAPEGPGSLGVLEPERMGEAYRAADVLLAPSYGEGLPLVVQEALASGLPVVVSDDPGYRDTLRAGSPGVTLAPRDAEAMAAAVGALLAAPALREDASVVAAAFARRAFSWTRAADEHEALYAELLGGR
jgi:glycosyltransferase involved in cell wall biosynthesis